MQKKVTSNLQIMVKHDLGETPQWWRSPLKRKRPQIHTKHPNLGD